MRAAPGGWSSEFDELEMMNKTESGLGEQKSNDDDAEDWMCFVELERRDYFSNGIHWLEGGFKVAMHTCDVSLAIQMPIPSPAMARE